MSSFTYERRLATFDHFNWPHSLAKTGNKDKFKSQPEDVNDWVSELSNFFVVCPSWFLLSTARWIR